MPTKPARKRSDLYIRVSREVIAAARQLEIAQQEYREAVATLMEVSADSLIDWTMEELEEYVRLGKRHVQVLKRKQCANGSQTS